MIKNKSVVHISTVRPLSDVRMFYLECCSLAQANFPISLIIHDDPGKRNIGGVSIKSIGKLYPMHLNLNLRLWHRITALYRAVRVSRSMPAKIYHLHDPELIPVGHFLKHVMKAKIIYDCREDYINYIKIRPGLSYIEKHLFVNLLKLMEWTAARCFDAIITADEATEELYKNYGSLNTLIVHNFPKINYFPYEQIKLHKNDKIYDLVYFGSIGRYYLEPAFCIASELKKRGRKIKWLFFGVINELNWACSEIERRGIKDYFIFEGRIPHEKVATKLSSCKIGIVHWPNLPKLQNNVSQKLFEFLAMGMPVIVSDLAGMRPYAKDKPYAISVTPDDYSAYADAIIYLIDHPVHREKMGISARQQVENEYNWENEFNKLKKLYSSLLEN